MTDKEFISYLKNIGPQYERLISRTLPVKIGVKAKSIFQENFRKGGFQDGGLQPWKTTRRQLLGNGADSKRGPLLSSRKVLYSSIGYAPERGSVTIFSKIVYAGIHNEGGTVVSHPKVTDKMRRYAWAMYYESGGGKKRRKNEEEPKEAQMWKSLALTKKQKLQIKSVIPKRQFMGNSKELNTAVTSIIETEVSRLFDSN